MKTLKFKNTEVKLSFDTYRNNGTLAVLMNTVPDDELYGVITVNLGSLLQTDRLAFVSSASLMIRRWSIWVDLMVPTVIIFLASGRLAELRRRIQDSS